MPYTVYCKKCCCEVSPGETCPVCSASLKGKKERETFTVYRRAVTDWMCWNRVMRVYLPAWAFLSAALLVPAGVTAFATGRSMNAILPPVLLPVWMLLGIAVIALLLLFQGVSRLDCTVDSHGVRMVELLETPTTLQLLAHLRSPSLTQDEIESGLYLLHVHDLAWKDISRVDLWPEKGFVLLYQPAHWLRIPLPCPPGDYEIVLEEIRRNAGAKKRIILPQELKTEEPAEAKPRKARRKKADEKAEHLQYDELEIPPQERKESDI